MCQVWVQLFKEPFSHFTLYTSNFNKKPPLTKGTDLIPAVPPELKAKLAFHSRFGNGEDRRFLLLLRFETRLRGDLPIPTQHRLAPVPGSL